MDTNGYTWITKKFEELTLNDLYGILRARAEVFVKEQGIRCVDPDGTDYSCIHIFSIKDDKVCAYLRAFPVDEETIKVGRILAVPHGEGIGTALMEYAISELRNRTGCKKIIMDAQKHAVPFYEKLGFSVTSDEYLEENVVHVDMCMKL